MPTKLNSPNWLIKWTHWPNSTLSNLFCKNAKPKLFERKGKLAFYNYGYEVQLQQSWRNEIQQFTIAEKVYVKLRRSCLSFENCTSGWFDHILCPKLKDDKAQHFVKNPSIQFHQQLKHSITIKIVCANCKFCASFSKCRGRLV